jgi:hypothetical protein
MTTPLPEHSTIIDELRIRYHEGPLSEFEIAKYRSMAQTLKTVDPAKYLCAQGMLACFSGKFDEMRDFHQRSIRISEDNALYIFNYACSLRAAGFVNEALPLALDAVRRDDMNLRYLNTAIWIASVAGSTSLEELLSRWEKLNRGEKHAVQVEQEEHREVTRFCLETSGPSLAQIWDTPEEDAAWAHLQ